MSLDTEQENSSGESVIFDISMLPFDYQGPNKLEGIAYALIQWTELLPLNFVFLIRQCSVCVRTPHARSFTARKVLLTTLEMTWYGDQSCWLAQPVLRPRCQWFPRDVFWEDSSVCTQSEQDGQVKSYAYGKISTWGEGDSYQNDRSVLKKLIFNLKLGQK